MAVISMEKISLCVHRSVATDVLRAVQKLGVIEFVEVTEKNSLLTKREKTSFEFDYVSNRLDFAVTFLSKFEKKSALNTLKTMVETDKIRTTDIKFYEIANSFYYNEIIEATQDIEEKLNNAQIRIKSLNEEKKILLPWISFESKLSQPLETKNTTSLFISGKTENLSSLRTCLDEKKIAYHETIASPTHIFIIFFKEHKEEVEKTLRDLSIETHILPKRRGSPKKELERIFRAIKKEEEKIIRRTKRAEELTKNLPQLKIVSDYIYWKKNKHNLLVDATSTKDVLVFEGWCPEKKILSLEKNISKISNLFTLEKMEPKEGDAPPVEIENNSLVRPFESITRLYGLPGYKDLDPTLFLAGFFFIFFGLCLTDVGYGITLFLITFGVIAFYHVPKDLKKFLYLLMFGGIASIVIGLFFGGYLGFDISSLPTWLQNLQLFDPIKNPIPVFILALSLGTIQIMAGLFLKIISEKKNGNLLNGILDQGPWLFVFIMLIVIALNQTGFISGNPSWFMYGMYIAVASLILTQGRKEKNIFMKAFKGVFSLYDSISFFSDILSYSRLLALGLATSALAFAVNLIAMMAKDIPYVGFGVMVIILVLGHLFNMAINVLGAFIHSARLQFVEFFGKFITASGKTFKPFNREERYVIIENSPQ